MKKIIPIIFFLVFAVIGVGMLIGSFSILNMETSAMDGAEEITAYITDIQAHRDSDGDVDHDVQVLQLRMKMPHRFLISVDP